MLLPIWRFPDAKPGVFTVRLQRIVRCQAAASDVGDPLLCPRLLAQVNDLSNRRGPHS